MRKDEYINEVISKIENKKARREVEKELSAHIDDRISYYTDAGYDEETANEKSIAHMGEPKKVGIQMAKLHKKNKLAVVAISLLVAIILTSVVLLFTTPISAQFYSWKFDSKYAVPGTEDNVVWSDIDWFYVTRKCGSLMNIVYKINPSVKNLDACSSVYSISHYKYGKYYNNEVPKDYLKNSIKYYEKLYNSEYRDKWNNEYAIPVVSDRQVQWKLGWGVDYAMALYADGQVEKSKEIINECLGLITEEYSVMYWTMKDYFYYAYTTTDDAALKDWIVEKENEINETCKSFEKYKDYFKKHDSIYYNAPSFNDYMEGWEEYETDEKDRDYDRVISNISQMLKDYNSFESESMRSDVAAKAKATFMGENNAQSTVLKYKYDNHLTFEINEVPFKSCVFYLDGKEYKTVELK